MTTQELIKELEKFDPNSEPLICVPFHNNDGTWTSYEMALSICYVSDHEYREGPDSPIIKPAWNSKLQQQLDSGLWRNL